MSDMIDRLNAALEGRYQMAEIRTTANPQHPHILPLFDSGEADGFLFYVMPFVEGESLRERLDREKQLPVDEAVRIATDTHRDFQLLLRRFDFYRYGRLTTNPALAIL